MNNQVTKITTSIIMIFILALSVSADQKYLEIDNFDGIEIGTGMIGTVSCGSKNTVTLIGDSRILDHIDVSVRGGLLDISRKSIAQSIINSFLNKGRDGSIKIEITTNSELSKIEGSTGSTISVPQCAVNTSYLEVDISTGAQAYIEGSTATLELDLSTGAIFNSGNSNLSVNLANIELSTGAIANLCGANTINGDASTGAIIKASETANYENISLSLGSKVTSRRCR